MKAKSGFKRIQTWFLTILVGLLGTWAGVTHAQENYDEAQVKAERWHAARVSQPDALDKIIAAGVIRIAVSQDLPPFGAVGPKGKLEGYDIDVAHLIAEDLGVRLELVPVTSANRIPWLMSGNADLVVANLGVNPERAKSIAFSAPYAPFFSGVFGPSNINVKGIADLQGKRVAVTRDTLEERELSKLAPKGVEVLRFEDNNATISAFLSGQADFIVTGNSVAATIAKKNPDKKIENKFIIKESPASIGVRRGEPELLRWINVFVFHKKLGGDLDRLSRKWFGEPLRPLPPL